MTTMHHSPPPGATPFAIYEDPEEDPSDIYEGDLSFSSEMSGADVAIPTIEGEHDLQDEPEPYNGSYTSRRQSILSSSRRGSAVTTNSLVSSLPSDISVTSKPVVPANALESRYSPRKERPPFRNPSSVRAMQMASPPPLLAPEASRERTKGGYGLATPSRSARSESVSTTGTRRSRSHRDSLHRDYQAQSPRPTATPQPLPLVLLHVTILPMQMPHTPETMVKIMPEWLVENYKVLEDKLQDIVLMRRGLLIQHPKDEYDLLEERILESLELRTPRLLKCGHFVAPDSDDEDLHQSDDEANDDQVDQDSRMGGGTITGEGAPESRYPTPNSEDASVCLDCHRQVKKPGHGVGAGTKRWDIKIYAANGLMRAGAWAAAWSEMERCDVEITPWIPNEVRKTLEKRLEQEQEAAKVKALYAAELQRQIQEEAAMQKKLEEEALAQRKADEVQLQKKIEAEAAALQRKLEEEAAEKRQLEATLNEKIEAAKEAIRLEFEAQALAEAHCVAERFRAMEDALKTGQEKSEAQVLPVLQVSQASSRSRSRSRHRSRSRRPAIQEVPLGTLLKNYLVLQFQDMRNLFIVVLGGLVVLLSMKSDPSWDPLQRPIVDVAAKISMGDAVEAVVPVSVTSTATMTSTYYSTLLVTPSTTVKKAEETLSPTFEEAQSALELQGQETDTLPKPETGLDVEVDGETRPSTEVVLGERVALSANGDENGDSPNEPITHDPVGDTVGESVDTAGLSMISSAEATSGDVSVPTEAAHASFNMSPPDNLFDTNSDILPREGSASGDAESSSIPVEEAIAKPSKAEKAATPFESASLAIHFGEKDNMEPETHTVTSPKSMHPQFDMVFDPLREHLAYCARQA